jgi:N-acetylmuramoyl-L-alanine amidase
MVRSIYEDAPTYTATQPLGGGDYQVGQGECVESIAFERGFFWKTIWDDPENSELKQAREDANVLLPGDRLHIPEKQLKEEPGDTEKKHSFRRKGLPSVLRLVLREGGEPQANTPYVLLIDSKEYRGTTDGQGKLKHSLPPNAGSAKLRVGDDTREFTLLLRSIDPVESIAGLQSRLRNLGYFLGDERGTLGPLTCHAIQSFQENHDLEATGELNEATQRKLKQIHGC